MRRPRLSASSLDNMPVNWSCPAMVPSKSRCGLLGRYELPIRREKGRPFGMQAIDCYRLLSRVTSNSLAKKFHKFPRHYRDELSPMGSVSFVNGDTLMSVYPGC